MPDFGSIYALANHPTVAPENPMDAMGKMMSMQNMAQQNQMGGLQLQQAKQDQQDQQTIRQLQMSGQPLNQQTLAQAGVSPRTAQGVLNQNLDYQTKVAAMAKTIAETSKTQGEVGKQTLDAQQAFASDMGKLGLQAVQDPTFNQDKWSQGVQQVAQKYQGVLPAPQIQAAIQPYMQYSPDVAGAVIAKARTYQDAHDMAFGKTQSDATGISQVYPPKNPGDLPEVKPVVQLPQSPLGKVVYDAGTGNLPDATANAYLNKETMDPLALERAKIQIQQQLNPSAVAGVAPHLVTAATSAYEKAGEKLAEAQSAANDMQTFINAARAGNKIAYAYAPVEGVLTLNTGRGVKRVNMSEIESYGGAGSLADKIKGYLGKQTSGASLPPDILNDMESLHSTIAQNAQDLHQKSVQVINGTYGSKFQPMNFAAPAAAPGGWQGQAPGALNQPQLPKLAPQDAMNLPKGTHFLGLDGVERVKQ